MPQMIPHIVPKWLPSLLAYEYLRFATKRDWAWEFLRRNFEYQASARIGYRKGIARVRLAAGPMLTRLRARHVHAEAWGLACFR